MTDIYKELNNLRLRIYTKDDRVVAEVRGTADAIAGDWKSTADIGGDVVLDIEMITIVNWLASAENALRNKLKHEQEKANS